MTWCLQGPEAQANVSETKSRSQVQYFAKGRPFLGLSHFCKLKNGFVMAIKAAKVRHSVFAAPNLAYEFRKTPGYAALQSHKTVLAIR